MNIDFLSPSQAWLLEKLVKFQKCGELIEPFIPVPAGTAHYVIYLRTLDGLQFRWLSDLDVLCLHQFLSYRWNRMSTAKAYQVTKLAHTAIAGTPTKTGHENSSLNLESDAQFMIYNQKELPSIPSLEDDGNSSIYEALRNVIPSRDLEEALIEVNFIESAINQDIPNKKQVIQQIYHLLRFAQNFLPEPRTLSEVEQQADFFTSFGLWQKSVVERLTD